MLSFSGQLIKSHIAGHCLWMNSKQTQRKCLNCRVWLCWVLFMHFRWFSGYSMYIIWLIIFLQILCIHAKETCWVTRVCLIEHSIESKRMRMITGNCVYILSETIILLTYSNCPFDNWDKFHWNRFLIWGNKNTNFLLWMCFTHWSTIYWSCFTFLCDFINHDRRCLHFILHSLNWQLTFL